MNVEESYQELGLRPGCSDADVKAAWRRLAARWHPDRNSSPQALRKIQRINRALDEIRRSRASSFGPITGSGFPFETAAAPTAPPQQQQQQQRQHDEVDRTIQLTLEEALAGCVRDIEGELVEGCVACGATGLQKHPRTCPDCGGTGQLRPQLWFAWVAPAGECRTCAGVGKTHPPCGLCSGSGKTPARRYHCRARIPGGVRDGDLLHASASVRSRQAGEKVALTLHVEVLPHELFTLDDDGTVRCELPVDGFAWIANRWIEVPTPAGLQQMRLKRGYHTYRIRGEGFPTGESGERADCIVTVVPLFPEELTKSQERQIDRLIAANTNAAGTPAAERVTAWRKSVAEWAARFPAQAKDS